MLRSCLTVALGVLLSSCACEHTSPVIDLGYVKYEGFQNATIGINYYRGIRYAESPSGTLRWRAPVPIDQNCTYNGETIQASQYGPACYQGVPAWLPIPTDLYATYGQSEDCLILDVLVPIHPASDQLAVIVQLPAGGYVVGSSSLVRGDALVNRSEGTIIYVQAQYRLGMFGFLGGNELSENGVRNAGLLDQRAALEWVRKYIDKFGGDPSKVTIVGGSAGGSSVTFQMMANGASDIPPFRAAIAEYPWWQPFLNDSSQDLQFSNVLKLANCTDIDCLRSLSSPELQSVHTQSYITGYGQPGYGYGVFYYGPVVDGVFMKELPDQAFKAGRFYDVPIIVDHDEYEGYTFVNASHTSQIEETANGQILFPRAGPSFFSRLYQLYPASNFNSTFFQELTWFGDFIINCPTYFVATAAVDRNKNSSAVFKMQFNAGSKEHGASGPFLYSNTTSLPPGAPNATIVEILSSYYLSFVTTLDPNVKRKRNAMFWPSYSSGGRGSESSGESVGFSVLEFTDTSIVSTRDLDVGPQCDFWRAHGLDTRN